MAKYVIDTNDLLFDMQGCIVFGVKDGDVMLSDLYANEMEEPTPDYINEHFRELQDEAYRKGCEDTEKLWKCPSSENEHYRKGLEDAWECARKIYEDLTIVDVKKAFGETAEFSELLSTLTPHEALSKLQAYEEKQKEDAEIKVGDEVTPKSKDADWKGIVIGIEGGDAQVMTPDGYSCGYPLYIMKRTGRHFPEVAQLLKKMKGE